MLKWCEKIIIAILERMIGDPNAKEYSKTLNFTKILLENGEEIWVMDNEIERIA